MGLQSQLNDVASDSIPLLLLALIASAVNHLRTLFTTVRHSFTHHHHHHHHIDPSGLTHLSSLNSQSSFIFRHVDGPDSAAADDDDDDDDDDDHPSCVFCLSKLRNGDRVRRLDCRHVFHKHCLDGWIHQMKTNCPLCRSQLFPDWRVHHNSSPTRVAAWFSVR